MTIDDYVAHRIAEAERLVPLREEKLEVIGGLAASGRIRLLAHDCEDDADVDAAARWPASIAEFPLTVSAARAARDRGMAVVMGAPNVIRGGSHSGNVAAAELVSLGLCTALASDYQPATMLASAFKLAADRVCDLPTAVALVSSGPASMSGLHDRGVIEPGRRADLVLAAEHGRWPHVVASWRSEGPVGRPALAVTPHADRVEVS